MRMAIIRKFLVWKLVSLRLLGDARFESALDGITGKIISAFKSAICQQNFSVANTKARQALKFDSVHGRLTMLSCFV